jgi:Mn-dependent DtxR family transcriptional regulator
LNLTALLSQTLVAFTIEFDNEFEHRMPHRTTRHGGSTGPWLVSMAMWFNCMRYVGEDGISATQLQTLARTNTNLRGMQRWGYITMDPDGTIRPTQRGRKAQEVWQPLFGVIEERWEQRFGTIADLRELLSSHLESDLPDCLPILHYGLFSRVIPGKPQAPPDGMPLPAMLSRVLLSIAIEFERASELSLAICANLLRVLDEKGVRVRDLPVLTGVSKESLSMAMGILAKTQIAVLETDKRVKIARLTAKGRQAQEASRRLLEAIEERFDTKLRDALQLLINHPAFPQGLEPYPDNWRASMPKPETLPHYPMVLHRGGFPDGS